MPQPLQDATLARHYDHLAAQQRWYPFWEQHGYFHSEPDPARKPFAIVIPPPNVTGALHLGHALNNTLQDVIVRFHRMKGDNTLWVPGTDHAGIATQAVVERRLLEEENVTRHDLGRKRLVERIWQWKQEYEARILNQLKQMGCSCDWQRTRFTLDDVCARAVRQTFFRLFDDGLVYRGKRLVNWDTFLQTAVSDDEVFHDPIHGHFWHFRYPVVDPKPGEPQYVVFATTRPETMLGDTAVAVHPDPAGALAAAEQVLTEKRQTAPSKDRAALDAEIEAIRARRRDRLAELIQLRDMAVDGRQVRCPLVDRVVPLIADPWAKPEMGSGCVKITPAHDPNDYDVARRCGLPMINILHPDGTLNNNAAAYEGLTIEQARERVTEDMDRRDLLVDVEDREIDLAHSDRSKTPIEPYLADQWFVKMDQLAQSAMDAVVDERVRIIPGRYAKGYLDWLGEKRDWPVGRQLWWGHRIPVWTAILARRDLPAEMQRLPHIEAIDADNLTIRVRPGLASFLCCQVEAGPEPDQLTVFTCVAPDHDDWERRLESAGMSQVEDVLDTWFSSALWPHSTLGWPDPTPDLQYFYPTSTLVTSRDIISLWVARMVLAGLYNVGDIPFREVYIHPKILDGYGEGMSKSKGNGVDPIDVMEKFGADALRFALAYLTTETQDVRMPVEFECPHCQAHVEQTRENRMLPRIECSKCDRPFATQWAHTEEDRALPRAVVVSERFELGRNFCNKLWNASRFVLLHLEDYTAAPVADDELALEDRWILSRLGTVAAVVTDAQQAFRFADAARALYGFAWDEFCSFYVEMLKPRLQNSSSRAVAQRLAAWTLDVLLRLLHPMLPFLTEEVWQQLSRRAPERGIDVVQPADESIMIAPWPAAQQRDAEVEERFARFQSVLGTVRELRSRQGISPKAHVDMLVRCGDATVALLQPMEPYFTTMACARVAEWGPEVRPTPTSIGKKLGDIDVYVDVAQFIDISAEIARLEKQQQKLETTISGKKKKLSDERFTTRAPALVVQRERESLDDLQRQLATTLKTLDGLRAGK